MSHTTYNYTRDRLGFEPDREEKRLQHYAGVTTYTNTSHHSYNGATVRSASHHQHTNGSSTHYQEDILTGGVYEENLEKFRGSCHAVMS